MSVLRALRFSLVIVFLVFAFSVSADAGWGNLGNDIEVVYLFEEYGHIDWPLIYHLACEEHCRVKMVTVGQGAAFEIEKTKAYDDGINLFQISIPAVTWGRLDSVYQTVSPWRQADIVISSQDFLTEPMQAMERYWLSLPYSENSVFQIRKVYKRDLTGKNGSVHINNSYYLGKFTEEMRQLSRELLSESPALNNDAIYSTYRLIKTQLPGQSGKASLLAGIPRFRLTRLASELMPPGRGLSEIQTSAEEYKDYLNNADQCEGSEKLTAMFDAFEGLQDMRRDYLAYTNGREDSPLISYLDERIEELSEVLIDRAGISFTGKPVLRETPQGTRLKLTTELRNNGPLAVSIGNLMLYPYWTDDAVVIDLNFTEVLPFKKFMRDYTIDIEDAHLKTIVPESLLITGEVDYNGRKIEFGFYAGTKVISPLSVKFLPDFVLIEPFSNVEIDRMVTKLEVSAAITKPASDAATVRIKIDTPGGIMAGAIKDVVTIPKGSRSYQFDIPLVATKSLPIGRDKIIINIFQENKLVASDTCIAGVANQRISQKVKIAMVPDREGTLEDIFVMTDANYRTISDRYLETKNLNYYDVIVIGSGSSDYYRSLGHIDGKLKQYMESGGTVLVFGQNDSWDDDNLPVSINPTVKSLSASDLRVKNFDHKLFKYTYNINPNDILFEVNPSQSSYPASVFPGEEIISTSQGGVLLSETRFQKGRLIYCGIPVPEMISKLDREALKFFTNLINYSGK